MRPSQMLPSKRHPAHIFHILPHQFKALPSLCHWLPPLPSFVTCHQHPHLSLVPQISEERSTIHTPTPRAQSLPPSIQETFDITGGSFESPIIDYEASVCRILSENPEDTDLQIHFEYPPPRSDVPIREETSDEEVGLQDNNNENTPLAPIYPAMDQGWLT